MPKQRLVCLAFLLFLLASCAPLLGRPDTPLPLPSPGNDWTLRLTQTGGFVGVNLSVEVTSAGTLTASDERANRSVKQTLPVETLRKLQGLYAAASLATPASPTMSCADCFNYELQARSGGQIFQLRLDDTNLSGSGSAELIAYLQQLRDAALRSQP